MSRRRLLARCRQGLALVLALYCAALFAAPAAAGAGAGGAFCRAHALCCHQSPARSFAGPGGMLPLCSRCLGLVLGFALGAALAAAGVSRAAGLAAAWAGWALLALFLEWLLEAAGIMPLGGLLPRAAAGLAAGLALHGLLDRLLERCAAWRSGKEERKAAGSGH